MWMSVDVHPLAAEEADQGLAAVAREGDGEAGRGGDGGDDRNASGEGFLHDLERTAARDEEDVAAQGEASGEEAMADDFIDGVVAPDVLAQDDELSVGVEKRGRVE